MTEETWLGIGWTTLGIIFLIWYIVSSREDLLIGGIAFLALGLFVICCEMKRRIAQRVEAKP
jgi:hydrogenase-4 membrane subunit HyfE